MGEEVEITDYDGTGVLEWEAGLPSGDDLTPLSQLLISPELASAFSIGPEPHRTTLDVNHASNNTLSSLRGENHALSSSNNFNFKLFDEEKERDLEGEDTDLTREGSDSRKMRRLDAEEADSASRPENINAAAIKRPRLVWTPQLHKRFVDVVAHLGIKNAVPKTIMQLMNVEGLTRENVASHLQKYRLYLKRMHGLSNEGTSASDHLFASTPVPQSLHESSGNGNEAGNGHVSVPVPMPYDPQMVPMPVYGYMRMPPQAMTGAYPGFDYNMMQ